MRYTKKEGGTLATSRILPENFELLPDGTSKNSIAGTTQFIS